MVYVMVKHPGWSIIKDTIIFFILTYIISLDMDN